MADLNQVFNDTNKYITDLESTYLAKFIADPTAGPDVYSSSVKSYCILSHAAFEEFAEIVSLTVLDHCVSEFVLHRRVNESLVALMHFKSEGNSFLSQTEEESKIDLPTSYDYVRKKLDDIKARFSKEVFNNHGVALKYLKQLFMPIAIDVPVDANWRNALAILSKERGSYAHRFLDKGSVKKSISPEQAKINVGDCLKLFEEIKNRANIRMNIVAGVVVAAAPVAKSRWKFWQ